MPEEVDAWLDASVYEVFILPTVPLNQSVIGFNLMLVYDSENSSGYYDFNEISFDLHSSNSFFYLANQSAINATILTQYGINQPDLVKSIQLFTAVDGIPINDYEMTLNVLVGETPLINSDIIVHVSEPLPSLSAPGMH